MSDGISSSMAGTRADTDGQGVRHTGFFGDSHAESMVAVTLAYSDMERVARERMDRRLQSSVMAALSDGRKYVTRRREGTRNLTSASSRKVVEWWVVWEILLLNAGEAEVGDCVVRLNEDADPPNMEYADLAATRWVEAARHAWQRIA